MEPWKQQWTVTPRPETLSAWFHHVDIERPTGAVQHRRSYRVARPTSPSSPGAAHRSQIEAQVLIERFRGRYPDARACLEADLAECLTYLLFPEEHHKRTRTTTLIERTFEESRRRTKVVPRLPTEGSCLSLMYATLITASAQRRGVRMTPKILRALDQLRSTERKDKIAA